MATVQGTTLGALLKRLRRAAGLTQEGLADRTGVRARAISDLERDQERLPRLETVTLLADALELDHRGSRAAPGGRVAGERAACAAQCGGSGDAPSGPSSAITARTCVDG